MTSYANFISISSPVDLQARDDLAAAIYRDLERNVSSRLVKTDSIVITASSGDDVVDAYALKAHEIQTVVISATGGTFKLSYGGNLTASIAYNATAAAVETALKAVTGLSGNVVVGGTAGSYIVQFVGNLSAFGDSTPGLLSQGAGTALTGGAGTVTVTQITAMGTVQA